jgi:hypothetical protein
MSANFAVLVENVRRCSADQKQELKSLLERYLIEERRREIKANGRRSRDELRRGRVKFSASLDELRESLAN